jgi:hypothetical protein
MDKICSSCAISTHLKEFISENGSTSSCSLCGKKSNEVVTTTTLDFIKMIKGLIRYYYSEVEYHTKLGGVSFDTLLSVENPVFNLPSTLSDIELEEFLLLFLDDCNIDSEISIFTAYGRDIYNYSPKTAVSLGKSELLDSIKDHLLVKNYYQVEAKFNECFDDIKDHITSTLRLNSKYYRARVGSNLKASNFDWRYLDHEDEFHSPFSNNDIGAPPIDLATRGRINRPGVSYLYLATNIDTAIAEVRPHPGENISIGAFTSPSKLKIADFSNHKLENKFLSDSGLDKLELIIAIENALSFSVIPSNSESYNITQFIAEAFRKIGFDGIKFKSSIGSGNNLVIFDSDKFKYVQDSGKVFKVKSVKYTQLEQDLYSADAKYDKEY